MNQRLPIWTAVRIPTDRLPDGTAWNYRIIDPRQFILTATFDL